MTGARADSPAGTAAPPSRGLAAIEAAEAGAAAGYVGIGW